MFLIQHRHPHTDTHKNPTHSYRNTHIHALHSYTHRQLVISSIIPVTHFCIHVHACVQTLQTRAGLYLSICHLLPSTFTIYFNTFFNKYLYVHFIKQIQKTLFFILLKNDFFLLICIKLTLYSNICLYFCKKYFKAF